MSRKATQIYLSPEQHRAVQEAARSAHCSMAAFIRDLIDRHVVQPGPPPTDLSSLIGIVKTGRPTNVAEEKDQMLYEALRDFR
jgi:hypothetical protein